MSVEKDVRTELGKLPTELKQQYTVIYNDILESAPSTAEIAKRTFSWMLAAQRELMVEELIAAVALDDDGYYHEDLDVSRLLDICRNLIVVTTIGNNSTTQNFQWAHLSVREYFDELSDYSLEYTHNVAVSRCLRIFDPTLQLSERLSSTSSSNPDVLRAYSIYLFEHAELSELTKANSKIAPHMKAFLFDRLYRPTAMFTEWQRFIEDLHKDRIFPQDTSDFSLFYTGRFDDHQLDGVKFICSYGLLSVIELLGDIENVPWRGYKSSHGVTALFAAASHGKYDIVKWLLEKKIFGADENHGNMTALYRAVWVGQEDIVALLLEHGADPLSGGQEGFHHTPLHMVFERRSLIILERLLTKIELMDKERPKDTSVIAFDWKHEALFDSLWAGWSPASQLLIHRGAKIYMSTSRTDESIPQYHQNATTLQVAVQCSELVVVSLLLEKSSKSVGAEVPEAIGISSGLESEAHLAYINALDQRKCSALHYLMWRTPSALDESDAIMKMLLKYGADSTSVSDGGVTVLHVAAAIDSLDSVNLLMGMGLNMKALTSNGTTILHFAAGGIGSTATMTRYLMEKGVDPLIRDHEGRTALHHAAAACNVPALLALLEQISQLDGLSQYQPEEMVIGHTVTQDTYPKPQLFSQLKTILDDVDGRGETLLHVVGSERKNTLFRYDGMNEREEKVLRVRETARCLLDFGANINKLSNDGRTPLSALASLSVAAHSGMIASKELLARRADPNIPDAKGSTPLHYAARCWWEEGAKDLIQAGANIEATDHALSTPLHVASRSGFPQMIKLLLSNNARCDAQDHIGATPLHYAVQDDYGGVEILIKESADIHALDRSGATPLHWAARSGKKYSVRRLIRSGADSEAIDKFGATAIQYAARHASIVIENEIWGTNYINVWLQLFRASEKWCRLKNLHPRTFLKRSQSSMSRIDQSWGDFSEIRAKELARV